MENYLHLWGAVDAQLRNLCKLALPAKQPTDVIEVAGIRFFWNEKDHQDWVCTYPFIRGLLPLRSILGNKFSRELALEMLGHLCIEPTAPPAVDISHLSAHVREVLSKYIGWTVTVGLIEELSRELAPVCAKPADVLPCPPS